MKSLIAIPALLCITFSAFAVAIIDDEQKRSLDKQLIDVVQGWGNADKQLAGLSALRIQNGEIAYEFYSGDFRELKRSGVSAAKAESLYRIASISKFVTSLAAMKLVEENKLDLDGDASDYLGFTLRNPAFPDVKITPRMLMSNTSSIVDGEFYSAPLPYKMSDFFTADGEFWQDGERFLDADAMQGLSPGEYFYYSNINFGLIGAVIENISGVRFDKYVKENILQPLNIEASYNVSSLSDVAIKNLKPIYRLKDGEWVPQVDDYSDKETIHSVKVENPDSDSQVSFTAAPLNNYAVGTNGTLFSPQGGLRASLRDLASITKMMLNRGQIDDTRIFQPSTITQMETGHWQYDGTGNGNTYDGLMQSYGLGTHQLLGNKISEGSDIPFADYSGGLVGHPGDAYGLLSGLYYNPETGDGYVYLISGTPAHDENYGEYSTFYLWEEAILSILHSVE